MERLHGESLHCLHCLCWLLLLPPPPNHPSTKMKTLASQQVAHDGNSEGQNITTQIIPPTSPNLRFARSPVRPSLAPPTRSGGQFGTSRCIHRVSRPIVRPCSFNDGLTWTPRLFTTHKSSVAFSKSPAHSAPKEIKLFLPFGQKVSTLRPQTLRARAVPPPGPPPGGPDGLDHAPRAPQFLSMQFQRLKNPIPGPSKSGGFGTPP